MAWHQKFWCRVSSLVRYQTKPIWLSTKICGVEPPQSNIRPGSSGSRYPPKTRHPDLDTALSSVRFACRTGFTYKYILLDMCRPNETKPTPVLTRFSWACVHHPLFRLCPVFVLYSADCEQTPETTHYFRKHTKMGRVQYGSTNLCNNSSVSKRCRLSSMEKHKYLATLWLCSCFHQLTCTSSSSFSKTPSDILTTQYHFHLHHYTQRHLTHPHHKHHSRHHVTEREEKGFIRGRPRILK